MCMSFFGMQPTFTQVPPRPHWVPTGVGLTKSSTATLRPNADAFLEAASPPDPPPTTTRSYSELKKIGLLQICEVSLKSHSNVL